MTLYSWFLRIKAEPKNKNIHHELSKACQSSQQIENYTMWPTAKVKPNAKLRPLNHNKTDKVPIHATTSLVDIRD